ncbi:MAG: alpha-ribazole phosphatase family protein [Gammaproteobacteria bacterium]|nr:alpha-ribazole phosphatase family protein [Gammaproteobacteria bacterium]
MVITTVDLLRHGEPKGGRRYRGQIDDPLSENGWREMWQAASGGTPWQHIISSPLSRCRAFANSLSEKLHVPLEQDERFREVGFGDWEGKTADELRAADPDTIRRFYQDPIENRPTGAEPLDQFSHRVSAALNQSIETHRGKHLLIVTHAGVIRAALTKYMSAPLGSMYRLSIATASISRIQIDEERPPTICFQGRRKI